MATDRDGRYVQDLSAQRATDAAGQQRTIWQTALDRSLRPLVLWGVFLTATGVSAYDWSFRVEASTRQERLNVHAAIVGRTAPAPERYRVLMPYLLDPPIRALARWLPYDKSFGRVYALFHWLTFASLLAALYRYLTMDFTAEQALVGTLVAASTLPMALRYYSYSPYSLLEPILFSIALILIRRKQHLALAALLAIATLNRETAIFIVFFYVAVVPFDRTHLRIATGYLAIWAAVYWAVRWYAGDAPRYIDLQTAWHVNTSSLEQLGIAATSWALLLGAFWVYAVLGTRRAPPVVGRTALVLPIYLLTILVWGNWIEVRLLLPMYPVLLPLALSYLFAPRKDAERL